MAKSKSDVVDMTDEGDSFVVDFSEIADLGPVPQGAYVASVVSARPGTSGSGYPKIDMSWKVEEGEFEGRQIFDTLAFHPNALPMTKRKLLQLGFPEDFTGSISPEDLIGINATLQISVKQSDQINPDTGEPYDPRNRVNKITGGDLNLDSVL